MKEIVQYYDVYHKFKGDLFWKKDSSFPGESLEKIVGFMDRLQVKDCPSSSYRILQDIKEKGRSVVYTFRMVPGSDSASAKAGDYSGPIEKYKISLRLKLK